ncbi:glycosyltransferase [Arthrospiribacter ruber]|uniref:Glycosyltransferase n=1 Tax=Arthrospiribacter ruber TaxID=2487934 RepID=A0A951ITA4_9BACT|nr:glycosyltransferase [Arthrospiribacter ruber]MBW3466349.1 glycosyltransferase [Arthrospiribacter ruber]
MLKNQGPIVSISCITYNHASFIRQTLNGFLMQKTNFDFEVLIHDDASTDGTQEIIKEYQEKYPEIIKPILQKENQYQKGLRGISRNFNYPRAKGKYIALCEGDDYWTDERKLQTQVDFLDENPSFVVSYHDAQVINEKGEIIEQSKMDESKKKDYSEKELISGSTFILTLSMMFRNLDILRDYPYEANMIKNGDNFLTSLLGMYGKGKYHPDIKPAVYRKHNSGIWTKMSDEQKSASKILSYYWTFMFFKRVDHRYGEKAYLNKISQTLNRQSKNENMIVIKKGIFSKFASFFAKLAG